MPLDRNAHFGASGEDGLFESFHGQMMIRKTSSSTLDYYLV